MRKKIALLFIIVIFVGIFLGRNTLSRKLNKCPEDDTLVKENLIINSQEVCNVADENKPGILIISSSNITINCRGTVLNGTETERPYDIYCFGLVNDGHANVTVKNCSFMNYGDALIFLRTENAKILNLNSTKNLNGIVFDEVENSTIHSNFLSSNNQGILLLFSDNNKIKDNYISKNNHGMEIEGSLNNLITGNTLIENNFGVWLRSEGSNKLLKNKFISNRRTVVKYDKKSYFINFSDLKPEVQYIKILKNNKLLLEKTAKPDDKIELMEGNYTLIFNHEGYDKKKKDIRLSSDVNISSNLIGNENNTTSSNVRGKDSFKPPLVTSILSIFKELFGIFNL